MLRATRHARYRSRAGRETSRFAFVTFLMLNDNYLPGALMLARALRRQDTGADLVCLVTEEISPDARFALRELFDRVVEVGKVFVPHRRRQERQDRPFFFTRLNALRLGRDGDLGFRYEKIVVLDADVLPLRRYRDLLSLEGPAGTLNERKSHFVETDADGAYVLPPDVESTGKWCWHRRYDGLCPHGRLIPREITDRVRRDPTNMGINGSLFVLRPSMAEFRRVLADVARPDVRRLVGDLFDWPDMQYLTMRWSGKWRNVDVRFTGFNGYPKLSVLFGTHFAGFKPWYVRRVRAMARYRRHGDFRFWFREFDRMMRSDRPRLRKVRRLAALQREIRALA